MWLRPALLVVLGWIMILFQAIAQEDASNQKARQLFDSLFCPPGQLPVQDLVAEGEELDAEGGSGHLVSSAKAKYFFKAPNLLRFDRVGTNPRRPFHNLLQVTVRDGDSFYIFVGNNYPSKSGVDPQIPPDSLPFVLTRYKKDASREFYYLGQETWKERAVHRIQILNPSDPGWTAICWIDGQRRVPVQAEYTLPGDKGTKPSKKRVVWSDVRQLPDGRYFPYQAQIFVDSKLTSMRVYKGVRINVGLENGLFRPIPELEKN